MYQEEEKYEGRKGKVFIYNSVEKNVKKERLHSEY